MSAAYHHGELVDLTIRGARVLSSLGDGLEVELSSGTVVGFNLAVGNVEVTRIMPADGEPQAGDVWQDRAGNLYFGRRQDGAVRLVSSEYDGLHYHAWQVLNRSSGPLTRVFSPSAGTETGR